MESRSLSEDSELGVHIEYEDLYRTFVFLVAIYVTGQVADKMKMPSLVGEILAGILLGPPLGHFVPNPKAWVLLGETGLVLLVIEAGIDIDVSTLSLVGTRGFMIAVLGSIIPIVFGIGVVGLVDGISDVKAAIAAGCCFGPTSLGIALNILKSGGVLNTPVGQLIISAAVIGDMIALVILSQLESLEGTMTVSGMLIPVISATAFLVVGGYVALFLQPAFVERFILAHVKPQNKGKVELIILLGVLLLMMPATYFAKASYLMGAFVAGLGFCSSHELHHIFVGQYKRLIQWLMRIFFAASIGFQVPILEMTKFAVVWKGVAFSLALFGKLAVGLMVPNFGQVRRYTGHHLRDCLITGFSMAAECEFALKTAVFAAESRLVSRELYASIVLAILLSTIVPPFLLRFTILYYNQSAEDEIRRLKSEEKNLKKLDAYELDGDEKKEDRVTYSMSEEQRVEKLVGDIQAKRAVFYRIQTQAEARWGMMYSIISCVAKLGIEMIDHRAWHTRGFKSTLVNEMYVRDTVEGAMSEEERMIAVKKALVEAIDQPLTGRVKIQRWYPGVVNEIEDSMHGNSQHSVLKTSENVEKRLLEEATKSLDYRVKLDVPQRRKDKKEEGMWGGVAFGYDAEVNVEGETFRVDLSHQTLEALRDGYAGELDVGGGHHGDHHGDHHHHHHHHHHADLDEENNEAQSTVSDASNTSSSNWHVRRQLRGYVRHSGRPGRPCVGPVVANEPTIDVDEIVFQSDSSSEAEERVFPRSDSASV